MSLSAEQISTLRRELADMTSPSLRDVIFWKYSTLLLGAEELVRELTHCHFNLFMAAFRVQDNPPQMMGVLLLDKAKTLDVKKSVLEDVNTTAVKELMEIVARQFKARNELLAANALVVSMVANDTWLALGSPNEW